MPRSEKAYFRLAFVVDVAALLSFFDDDYGDPDMDLDWNGDTDEMSIPTDVGKRCHDVFKVTPKDMQLKVVDYIGRLIKIAFLMQDVVGAKLSFTFSLWYSGRTASLSSSLPSGH